MVSGFSSGTHFVQMMGLSGIDASECRRVALALLDLPHMRDAAERGCVAWSSLVAIVSKATPETDAEWLDFARTCAYHHIRRMVRNTRRGRDHEPRWSPAVMQWAAS